VHLNARPDLSRALSRVPRLDPAAAADAAQLIVKGDLAFNRATAAMMLERGRQWSDAHPASTAAAVQTTGAPDLIW
jgi:hypothetical protein